MKTSISELIILANDNKDNMSEETKAILLPFLDKAKNLIDQAESVFEIEDTNGNTMMAFQTKVDDDGNLQITQTLDCSHADSDGDYMFNSESLLHRIQADEFPKHF